MPRRTPALSLAAALALAGCGHSDAQFLKPGETPTDMAAATAPATGKDDAVALHAPADTRKPFVVIHFDGAEPHYAQALYDALEAALARKPDAAFELVAVTRDTDAAERNLAAVLHAMTGMGMPAERLSLAAASAADDATDEVWIYVR
jgi:hypothetical protein